MTRNREQKGWFTSLLEDFSETCTNGWSESVVEYIRALEQTSSN